jgi:hypothetical protein
MTFEIKSQPLRVASDIQKKILEAVMAGDMKANLTEANALNSLASKIGARFRKATKLMNPEQRDAATLEIAELCDELQARWNAIERSREALP